MGDDHGSANMKVDLGPRAQRLQVVQHGEIDIHPSIDAVVSTGVFITSQVTGSNILCDAFLPADVGQVVNIWGFRMIAVRGALLPERLSRVIYLFGCWSFAPRR